MESFKPLRDLAQKMETTGDVTEQNVVDTIKSVKDKLKIDFASNPQKLEEINRRLTSLETLWKEKIAALKAAKTEDRGKIITETKSKLAEIELEAGKPLAPTGTPAENQTRLTGIQGEKETLKKSLTRTDADWTKKDTQINLLSLGAAFFDPKELINEGFKQPKIAEMLAYADINDEANKNELAAAMSIIAKDFLDKGGSLDKAADVAKPLINLLENLKDYYEKNKTQPNFPYATPNAMLHSFSDFTQTNFIKEKKIQQGNLVTFMKYSDPTFKLFLDKFKLYVPLLQEEKKLGNGTNTQPQAPNAAPPLVANALLENKELGSIIEKYCSKIEDKKSADAVRARLQGLIDQEWTKGKKVEELEQEVKNYFDHVLLVNPEKDEELKKFKIEEADKKRDEARIKKVKAFVDEKIKNNDSSEVNRVPYETYLLGVLRAHEEGALEGSPAWDGHLEVAYLEIKPIKEWKDIANAQFEGNLSPEAKATLSDEKAEKAKLYVAGLIAGVGPGQGYEDWKVVIDGEKKEFAGVYKKYIGTEMERISKEIVDFKGPKDENYYWDKVKNLKTAEQHGNELWEKAITTALSQPAPTPAPEVTPAEPQPGAETPPGTPSEPPPASPEAPLEGMPFSTGDPEMDKLIKKFIPYIAVMFPAAVPFLRSAGFKIEMDFAGLNIKERKDAMKMKEEMGKIELNLETLKPLFDNPEQMKRVLKQKSTEKGSWEAFLNKYLDPAEKAELKEAKQLEAKALADMLVSGGSAPS